ncbi:ABC transporter ATP-binding protein [Rickettsiales bacterium LUAb2]
MKQEPIIEVKNLSKSFGNKQILQDLNFKVFEKESIVILGQSGTGKSVLFKNMLGLIKPSSGSIFFNNICINNLSEKERFKLNRQISMVFQHSALFDSYTILENVLFGIINHKTISRKNKIKIATENLEKVGLNSSILNLYPSEISGGMQKRVGLARAIAIKPKIIFFDEPTSGLDPISSNVINELIVNITKNLGVTSLTITHDINSAKYIGSKILLLHNKTIYWEGSPSDLNSSNTNPMVKNFIEGKPY